MTWRTLPIQASFINETLRLCARFNTNLDITFPSLSVSRNERPTRVVFAQLTELDGTPQSPRTSTREMGYAVIPEGGSWILL